MYFYRLDHHTGLFLAEGQQAFAVVPWSLLTIGQCGPQQGPARCPTASLPPHPHKVPRKCLTIELLDRIFGVIGECCPQSLMVCQPLLSFHSLKSSWCWSSFYKLIKGAAQENGPWLCTPLQSRMLHSLNTHLTSTGAALGLWVLAGQLDFTCFLHVSDLWFLLNTRDPRTSPYTDPCPCHGQPRTTYFWQIPPTGRWKDLLLLVFHSRTSGAFE